MTKLIKIAKGVKVNPDDVISIKSIEKITHTKKTVTHTYFVVVFLKNGNRKPRKVYSDYHYERTKKMLEKPC